MWTSAQTLSHEYEINKLTSQEVEICRHPIHASLTRPRGLRIPFLNSFVFRVRMRGRARLRRVHAEKKKTSGLKRRWVRSVCGGRAPRRNPHPHIEDPWWIFLLA
jgi:hypothetical protein